LAKTLMGLRRNGEEIIVRGHIGGQFVSGRVLGVSGRYAELEVASASVAHEKALIGAGAASRVMRRDRSGGERSVPLDSLSAWLGAGRKGLGARAANAAKKKKMVAAAVVPLLGFLLSKFVFPKFPVVGTVLYSLAVSVYMCKVVVPRPLVLALAAVVLLSFAPSAASAASAVTASARAVALGVLLCALPTKSGDPESLAVCTGVDLETRQAKILWRALPSVEAGIVADEMEAAAGAQIAGAGRPSVAKGAALTAVACVLILACAQFHPLVHLVEAKTIGSAGIRLAAFGGCAGVALRLMGADVVGKGLRQVVPLWLSAAITLPAGTVGWFLAVNFRAAAVGAAMAVLLPPLGFAQKMAYWHGVRHQIEFVDVWLYRVSDGFVLCVLLGEVAKLAFRAIPPRPQGLPAQAACAAGRGGILAAATMAILQVALPAAGASSLGPSALQAAGAAAALVGAAPTVLRDWLARLCLPAVGGPGPGRSVWVRDPEGAAVVGPVQGRVLRWEGPRAVVAVGGREVAVGAAALWGAGSDAVRPLGCRLPVPGGREQAEQVAKALRGVLQREARLLHRQPFAPAATIAADGSAVHVAAFADRRAVAADGGWAVRSALLEEAAHVVSQSASAVPAAV